MSKEMDWPRHNNGKIAGGILATLAVLIALLLTRNRVGGLTWQQYHEAPPTPNTVAKFAPRASENATRAWGRGWGWSTWSRRSWATLRAQAPDVVLLRGINARGRQVEDEYRSQTTERNIVPPLSTNHFTLPRTVFRAFLQRTFLYDV
ncbi:hypothetical protein B0H13DRAFT_2386123 [Mycena leptocephala]|nr:hypothetical protein B0H13DRAFT_2386123 [Mycena leptocephala]